MKIIPEWNVEEDEDTYSALLRSAGEDAKPPEYDSQITDEDILDHISSVVMYVVIKQARVEAFPGLKVFLLEDFVLVEDITGSETVVGMRTPEVAKADPEAQLVIDIAAAPEVPDFLPSGPTAAELGFQLIPVRYSLDMDTWEPNAQG